MTTEFVLKCAIAILLGMVFKLLQVPFLLAIGISIALLVFIDVIFDGGDNEWRD